MYAIVIPDAVVSTFFQLGRQLTRKRDGWLSKRDGKAAWYVGPALKYAHKWQKRERAESAALLVVGLLPELAGKMVVVEVERLGEGAWRRVKSDALRDQGHGS